ncbi:disulfide bond formation protein B [Chryseobacterium paridis]|uniref:Disulfide bond formation protein B n=1 Tax=Chryseobacterium paridis TaxID=2800328 RepID=A0ABS1FZR5_9FLAO|nr:disulfide bond formation protein B [Chryseobacterium paridis]MBK1897936.1 disulfide bond formation protein B [Chryseobacterium paridis]
MKNQIIRYINILGIFIVSFILMGAYYFQFALNEYPCPLCLLQRLCFFGVIFGLLLNLKFEFKSTHYGLSIISALLGIAISFRQVLLHICPTPNDEGYGTPVLGMHLYSWALVAFIISILVISFLLLFSRQFDANDKKDQPYWMIVLVNVSFFAAFILVTSNAVFTFMECGFGFCPDDPVKYMILHGEWW